MRRACDKTHTGPVNLTPRYRLWFERWLFTTLSTVALNWIGERLTGSSPLPWKSIVAWLFVSPIVMAINIWIERLRQPRQFTYWSEGVEAGHVVRHRRTREVLLKGAGQQFTAKELRAAVSLVEADLREEELAGLELPGVCLRGANLQGAQLVRANLEGADLAGCTLTGTNVQWANLRGADLRGAQFGRLGLVYLRNADLKGARYNAATRWPQGFRPEHFDCRYEPNAGQALPIPVSTLAGERQNLPLAAGRPAEADVAEARR